MDMETRRDVLILAASIPLLTSEAHAADGEMVTRIFNIAVEAIKDPMRVRQNHQTLFYYLELLQRSPPKKSLKDQDLRDAEKTYRMIGEQIARTNGKAEIPIDPTVLKALVEAYAKYQDQLWEYLKEVGIEIKTPADLLIEQAIVTTMVFYAAVTKFVGAVENMLYCFYPFCFKRPI